jgi:opacity protein-like surface antigen
MKRLSIAAAAAALSVGVSTPSVSARDLVGGFGFGYAQPITDLSFPFGADRSVGGWLTGRIAGPVSWRAELGYDRFRTGDQVLSLCSIAPARCESHMGVTRIGAGLQLGGKPAGRLAPYAYLTLGLHHVGAGFTMEAETLDGITRTDSENDFGMAVGTGVDVRLGERTGLGFEGRYSGFAFGYGDSRWSSAIGATAHGWVRF